MREKASRRGPSNTTRREFLLKSAAGAAGLAVARSVGWAQCCATGCPSACPSGASGTEGPAGPTAGGPWRVLFDGKDLGNWRGGGAQAGPPGKGWIIEDGAMVRSEKAGDIWTRERFGDFVLDLEAKTKGNSGIFIRTDDTQQWLHTGIEIAIDKSFGKTAMGVHDFGAVYDCLAPKKNALKGPDDWQRVVITCNDNRITIEVNGELTTDMDLNLWTEAGKNPPDTGKPTNKFKTAYKDMKREGHIGLQDHGAWVAYRNVRIKALNPTPAKSGGPACPVCGAKGNEGDYCAKCNAVVTALGEYKCTMCGKTVKSGTYCDKHNKFRFNVNDDVKCPKCGKTKGTWCDGCGQYACLPAVTFCEKCKKPFDKVKHSATCPKCGTKVEPKMKAEGA